MLKYESVNSAKINVPCEEKYLKLVRLFVSGMASQMNFPFDIVEEIKIAVSEAFQNIIEHAYSKKGKNHNIEIICKPQKKCLKIMVRDHGHGFNIEKAYEKPGFGLTFMKEFMDLVKLKSTPKNGTTLTLVKYTPK